ncbi:MAG TPA: DUF3592 domain-containing protein [Candidatus Limnocylindria bacterium]|jgi:hypothetical protein|nr:DUF3592 domain-containing protein [Candidatus Limnocylindria bacterium]
MARRHWEFDLEDGHHVVDLVHGYFFGKRTITADGVTTTQGGTPLTDHSGEYRFPLGTHDARLRISTNGFKYFYDLVVDGRSVSGPAATGIARPGRGGPSTVRLTGALLAVLAVPLLAFTVKGAYDEYRYQTASATATGTVQDKRVSSGRYSDTYRLTYAFVDRGGVTRTGRGEVSRATYDQARVGSRYTIQYLPDEPDTNRVLGHDDILPIAGLMAGSLFGLALGVFLFVSSHRRLAAAKRIGSSGQPVSATVTKLKKSQVRGVGTAVTLEYEYDDPYGRRRRGRGPLMYPSEAARYTVGGAVRVLIDPDRPGDSLLP